MFVSFRSLRLLGMVAKVADAIGKPAVSSYTTLFWHPLRSWAVGDERRDLGGPFAVQLDR